MRKIFFLISTLLLIKACDSVGSFRSSKKNDKIFSVVQPPKNTKLSTRTEKSSTKVVCYYTNWSQYRLRPGDFLPENIDPFLCTHIIYAFADLSSNSELKPFEWNDLNTEWSVGMYSRVMDLKKINKDLKILLAVGGWNMGSYMFSKMVHDDKKRKHFINTSVNYLLEHEFDGLDLDWEYPGSRNGSKPTDKQLYTKLCQEMKEAFKPHSLLLTAAVGVGMSTVEKAYEIKKISESLDFINLMTYDFHGSWEYVTGHNAPLWHRIDEDEKAKELNVDYVVRHWLKSGAPKEKLILGLATYGRTFRLEKASESMPGDKAVGPGDLGRFSAEGGFLTYYEICKKVKEDGWFVRYDRDQATVYAHKGVQWVSFDDVSTLARKADYFKEMDLGGVMFWSLDTDDFKGEFCGQGKYPLIKSVLKALSGDSSLVDSFTETPLEVIQAEKEKLVTKPNSQINGLSVEEIEAICPDGDGHYSDFESDCDQYYVCSFTHNIEHVNIKYLKCPENLKFDSILKTCNFADQVKCEKMGRKQIIKVTTNSGQDKRNCSNGDALYLIENTNCKKYYLCAFSGTEHELSYDFRCPSKRLFNVETQKCENDFKCDDLGSELDTGGTKNVCEKNGDGYYADKSRGCRYYFKCLFIGTYFERITELECPENSFFNDETKDCDSANSCT